MANIVANPTASELLVFCERCWDALDHDAALADELYTVIAQDDRLLLVSNAIPELRPGGSLAGLSDAKRELVHRLRPQPVAPPSAMEAQRAAEQSILDSAAMSRASVTVLRRRDALDDVQTLRAWLDLCPLRPGTQMAHVGPLNGLVDDADGLAGLPTLEDMHRISLLVWGHCKLYDEHEWRRVREWLAACPICDRQTQPAEA